jgi:pyruvate carboxylase
MPSTQATAFLSERADFAQACADAGVTFVGPAPQQLAQFGDKAQAIALARPAACPSCRPRAAMPRWRRSPFFDAQGGNGIVIKAVGGGGGRGMRVVTERAELAEAYTRCKAEARSAFGMEAVYGERLVVRARHIEVQIVGDGQQAIAWASATARCSAAFRSWWRLRPARCCCPRCASRSPRRR